MLRRERFGDVLSHGRVHGRGLLERVQQALKTVSVQHRLAPAPRQPFLTPKRKEYSLMAVGIDTEIDTYEISSALPIKKIKKMKAEEKTGEV